MGLLPVSETDTSLAMEEGPCEAAFFHPEDANKYPPVLLWPDAGGLRPTIRNLGRQLASEGFSVLVPNLFYRTGKPGLLDVAKIDFTRQLHREILGKFTGPVAASGAAEQDAGVYLDWLYAQPSVDTARPAGVHGYCLGGLLALRTAIAHPGRIKAIASLHGGGLVTSAPDSPHRRIAEIKANVYVGIAANDDEKQPEAKDQLSEAFAKAAIPAEVEVYPGCLHGWCIADMPVMQNGTPIYNAEAASRSAGKLLHLYRNSL